MLTVTIPRRRLELAVPRLDGARLALLLLCVAFFALGTMHFTDPDYWWHLRTGQFIVETRSVPQTDPFSFTAEGQEWLAHEWLSEVVIYGVQSAGGYAANVILFTTIALASLLIAYRSAAALGAPRMLAVLLLAWALIMAYSYWTVRPQAFTWLLFAAFLAVVIEHRKGHNLLWLLPVLMVFWANLHLGFIYGLLILGIYVVASTGERIFWKEERDLKGPLLALAGCVAATALSPHPGELLIYPIEYFLTTPAERDFIAEWQTPDFHSKGWLPLVVAILSLVYFGCRGRHHDLFLPVLAVAFVYLALYANRNVPLFAIVFLVVMAAIAAERWTWTPPAFLSRRVAKTRSAVNWTILLVIAVVVTFVVPKLPTYQLHAEANLDGRIPYPAESAAFIRAYYSDARMFNSYNWGGYLVNELYPQKVFIDGRADMYGAQIFADYVVVGAGRPGWEAVLDRYRIDLVLTEEGSTLAERLGASGKWTKSFGGTIDTVFIRNEAIRHN